MARADRPRELRRRREIHPLVEPQELPPVELLELAHGLRRVVVPKPPEPVRALAEAQLPGDAGAHGSIARGREHAVAALLRSAQQIPRAVLRRVADPCRDRALNPPAPPHLRYPSRPPP